MRWAHLGDGDIAALTRLFHLVEQDAGTEDFHGADFLGEQLHSPGLDPARDTWALRDSESGRSAAEQSGDEAAEESGGELVAYGYLRVGTSLVDGQLWIRQIGGVHPGRRGEGIGSELLQTMESRAKEVAAERFPGCKTLVTCGGGLGGSAARPLLEERGYQIARHFTEMVCDLPGAPLPEPAAPVRGFTPDLSEAVRLAHNDAFSTHWGSTPSDPRQWAGRVASGTFRPELSFIAVSDGEVQAYVLCTEPAARELYVQIVGTRRSARGQGLSRACLTASLRAAVQRGYTSASLGVDSTNPTGAGALYESVGFRATKTVAVYSRVLAAA